MFLIIVKNLSSLRIYRGLPGGVVARLQRAHRRGRGSLSAQGTNPKKERIYQGVIFFFRFYCCVN